MPLNRVGKQHGPGNRALKGKKKTTHNRALNAVAADLAPENGCSDKAIELSVRGPAHKRETTIQIQPQFLFSHSPYFKRILQDKNGKPKILTHKDLRLDSDAMNAFAFYCYTNRIKRFTGTENNPGDVVDQMLDLWLLGRRLEEVRLQNQAIDKAALAMTSHNSVLDVEHVRRIYEEKGQESPLRRWIMDVYAWSRDSDNLGCLDLEDFQRMPERFKYDLLNAQCLKLGKGKEKIRHENPNKRPERYHLKTPTIEILDDEEDQEVIRLDSPGLFVNSADRLMEIQLRDAYFLSRIGLAWYAFSSFSLPKSSCSFYKAYQQSTLLPDINDFEACALSDNPYIPDSPLLEKLLANVAVYPLDPHKSEEGS